MRNKSHQRTLYALAFSDDILKYLRTLTSNILIEIKLRNYHTILLIKKQGVERILFKNSKIFINFSPFYTKNHFALPF